MTIPIRSYPQDETAHALLSALSRQDILGLIEKIDEWLEKPKFSTPPRAYLLARRLELVAALATKDLAK